MKRPKRAKALVYKKYTEIIYQVRCPHCHTDCVGINNSIDRMRCSRCSEIIMVEWPEIVE